VVQINIPQEAVARVARRDNRRVTVRYRCAPATLGHLYAGEDHEFQRAWMLDVSLTGIAFMLARSIPAGSTVAIHLRGQQTATDHTLEAYVVHCTFHHDGEWLVGCRLTKALTDEVLDDLL
jgi:c-di-GMP-binding flagellar brake protein YcgR